MFTLKGDAGMNVRLRACATYWLNARRLHAAAAAVDRYYIISPRGHRRRRRRHRRNRHDGASERTARRTTPLVAIANTARTTDVRATRTGLSLRLLLVDRTWTRWNRDIIFEFFFNTRAYFDHKLLSAYYAILVFFPSVSLTRTRFFSLFLILYRFLLIRRNCNTWIRTRSDGQRFDHFFGIFGRGRWRTVGRSQQATKDQRGVRGRQTGATAVQQASEHQKRLHRVQRIFSEANQRVRDDV